MNTPQQTDNGGPAFPFAKEMETISGLQFSTGMTLRDWFAGMALQAKATRLNNPHNHRDILAADCYDIADAMIAAREVKP
jgi:hypothetical protein